MKKKLLEFPDALWERIEKKRGWMNSTRFIFECMEVMTKGEPLPYQSRPANMVEDGYFEENIPLPPAPVPLPKAPEDLKPWLKVGAFAWPQEMLEKYGMEAMLEWVEKVAKPKWYEYDNPVFPHQLDCILKGIPYVRPKFVQDAVTGRMRVATAEETAELLAKEKPPVVPQSDEWA